MEISLPSTRAPAVAPDTLILGAAKSGPQVYNMIFLVRCLMSAYVIVNVYMLHHNPYLHYPYHLHDLDPHFDYF